MPTDLNNCFPIRASYRPVSNLIRKGSGGRPVISRPSRKTVTLTSNANGIQMKFTKGNLLKTRLLKAFIDEKIHSDSKTVSGYIHPILCITSIIMTMRQYVYIARILYPVTNFWCVWSKEIGALFLKTKKRHSKENVIMCHVTIHSNMCESVESIWEAPCIRPFTDNPATRTHRKPFSTPYHNACKYVVPRVHPDRGEAGDIRSKYVKRPTYRWGLGRPVEKHFKVDLLRN